MAERTCIVTRETKDTSELIRFVKGPDGSVVPDLKRKLPGRGVWVSGNKSCVAKAVSTGREGEHKRRAESRRLARMQPKHHNKK